ncbi:TadE/TadG family type IV pilus assembly protein [Rhodobacter sp. SY28-1]|uniref:TadE/TadG family type IV pilus assembly protein n=1 Tax=Rhodobacter sp. SY28-1 TaxID=2562317 RepID=UPI001485A109|nr:Tad domain-containing protein [Rhodobacter sp. SY28-1]
MFEQAAKRSVSARLLQKVKDFRSDEHGAIAIFVLLIFVMMLLVGGIAVDVMRSEMRRVTYQQTFDRAVLAASNIALPPSQTPTTVGQSWYDIAGLGDQFTVDYITPTITGEATTSSRKTEMTGKVRSYNHFMHLMDIPYFEIPVKSAAQQGIAKVEVMMVLDITGSMSESSGSTTKIAALRQAATNFVTILKYDKDSGGNYTIPKDPYNLMSIGMVPYSSNVNIPVALRNQFTVQNLSWWDGVADQGVPDTNCFEIPESTYSTTSLSLTNPIRMQAVAQTAGGAPSVGTITLPGANNTNGNNGGVIALSRANPTNPAEPSRNTNSYTCNHGDNFNTGGNEKGSNLIALPTTDINTLKTQINQLNPRGTTSIAVGMRWGTALIDEAARPIYTNLLGGVPGMAGRPANNDDIGTKKYIVLMTDGTHVASKYILDAYKTGPSPIWRGADGRYAIEFNDSGSGLNGGTRPGINPNGNPKNSCSGWSLADKVVNGVTVKRNFFVPHLKENAVTRTTDPNRAEGNGNSGSAVTGACDPRAWVAPTNGAPTWSGSGVVRRLDWSEVWRYLTVDWVVEQLYMRSNVSGATNYNTVYNTFVGNYLAGEANMNALLNTNCTAAKQAGVEVFGIVLGDDVTPGPIQNCSSPGNGYFYWVKNANDLNAAFEQIAVLISELKLTQ